MEQIAGSPFDSKGLALGYAEFSLVSDTCIQSNESEIGKPIDQPEGE